MKLVDDRGRAVDHLWYFAPEGLYGRAEIYDPAPSASVDFWSSSDGWSMAISERQNDHGIQLDADFVEDEPRAGDAPLPRANPLQAMNALVSIMLRYQQCVLRIEYERGEEAAFYGPNQHPALRLVELQD